MNEARLEAYLNLIESLLICTNGEENQILQDNSELVDAGLVQVMTLLAESEREKGNENATDFLIEWARYLTELLAAPSDNSQLEFLMQLLRATSDSEGNRNVIYPLLRNNLNLVNDNFAAILRNWAAETLLNLDDQSIYTSLVIVIGNFSNAICEFSLGSKEINLEIAIAGYEVVMTVFTRQEYAEYWATFQNSLGVAYNDRIRGEKADNLERSIAFYQAALSVRTHEAFPQDWAATQNNLGLAYNDRIRGQRADNIEKSIAFYQAALSVYTRDAFSQEWAMTQHNLGLAYSDRIKGEKADNFEKSIAFYQAALSVSTDAFPQQWAMTQYNLGRVYKYRIRGEKAENIEKSIAFYQAALSVSTEAFPQDWARVQNGLGVAYNNRIMGEKAENIEKSIAFYQAGLSVYTSHAFPQDWAMIQHNLGVVYNNRIRGKKAENIELAIAFYQAALSVRTHEAFPQDWAATQNNLGLAYNDGIRGQKAENIELAIAYYLASLTIYTREAFPINNARTLYSLGCAYRDISQLPEAYNTFNSAIETVELMRSEIIIGGEADRQKLAEQYNRIYQEMVDVCLEMENSTAALEYVERSKTRNLVELFHKARSLPEKLQRISFAEIRSLLAENEAILEWYITPNGFKVFIITRDSPQPDVWQSSYQDLQALEELQQEYLDDIKDEEKYDNWKNQLDSRLEKLAQILDIDEIISRLPENCQKLILVPFRYLHLFPLHALTSSRQKADNVETGCLLELFPGGVRYTPSCQLLQLSQRVNASAEDTSPSRFFAIQNPTEDLDFTDIEVEAIAKSFNPAEVLSRQNASKAGLLQQIASLQNADIAHFSCHGFFDFLNPEKSALILAGAKIASDGIPSEEKRYVRSRRGETFDIAECLTLTEIFDLQLSKCRLVALSACETALTDARNTTDEYIGLTSGFFYAGATSVLSTLWAVNDVSTAILMIKFYELLGSESRPAVSVALRESQLWLRDLSVADLQKWTAASKLLSSEHKEKIKNRYRRGFKQDYQPYQSPMYWAPFCAVGQ